MADVMCCGAIEKLREWGWDLPFENTLMVEHGPGKFALTYPLVITLMRYTPRANVSKTTSNILVKFCPFCGQDLAAASKAENA